MLKTFETQPVVRNCDTCSKHNITSNLLHVHVSASMVDTNVHAQGMCASRFVYPGDFI